MFCDQNLTKNLRMIKFQKISSYVSCYIAEQSEWMSTSARAETQLQASCSIGFAFQSIPKKSTYRDKKWSNKVIKLSFKPQNRKKTKIFKPPWNSHCQRTIAKVVDPQVIIAIEFKGCLVAAVNRSTRERLIRIKFLTLSIS